MGRVTLGKQILTVYIATFTEANVVLLKEMLVARKKLQWINRYHGLDCFHYGSMLRCRFSFGLLNVKPGI
jgi:hypothetical protein